MVCFRQIEAKQVQNANDYVKLSGDPKVEGKIGDQVADELERIVYVPRSDHQIVIYVTVQDKVEYPPEHPLHSLLVNSVLFFIEIRSAERAVINDRKERKDDVWR